MSSAPIAAAHPAWNAFPVVTFGGQHDTNIETGEVYRSIPLSAVFEMSPSMKPKNAGDAFLPSSYLDHDARKHAAQREHGMFVSLVGDIDKGDLPIDDVIDAAKRFAGGCAWLVYSSAHSRSGDHRWRVVVPLARVAQFDDWYDAQTAFFTYMEGCGIPMDRALSRAGQPVYLPNVPEHYKDGTPLRDPFGEPIYYQTESSGIDAEGLDLTVGIVAGGIASIRQQRIVDDRAREIMRKAAAERHAKRRLEDGNNIFDRFNASTSLPTMLKMCGYTQSPRCADDWRSPHQEGETYATRVIDGHWVSLSASDAAYGVGQTCKSGCFGDAYDLLVHYKHGDDHKSATRQLAYEERGANVVTGNFRNDDPGYSSMPEGPHSVYAEDDLEDAPQQSVRLVQATPFAYRNTSEIPPRKWLYGKHLLRKFVSLDVAAGGVGKSSLKVGEALAMASGRDIYDKDLPEGALTVWLWNLEDPHEEIERRLHATMQRFDIKPDELEGRLYVDSGRDQPLVMATEGPDGAMIVRPLVEALIEEMIARKIDVLQVDPFISSHAVSENDNNAIDIVAREWNVVAERTGAAINLVHHVRKGNGAEATADSARGASALIGKARSVLVYNRMSEDDAAKLGVDDADRFYFFRVDNDKSNLAPAERGDWYRMNNEDLSNGDKVGVACRWTPPDAFSGVSVRHLYEVQKAVGEGNWRENSQAGEAWVGNVVANVLSLDLAKKHEKRRVGTLLSTWIAQGALEVVDGETAQRKPTKFVVVGKWAEL